MFCVAESLAEELLKLAEMRQAHNYRGKHNNLGWNSYWRKHTSPRLHLFINYIQDLHFQCVLYKYFSVSGCVIKTRDTQGNDCENEDMLRRNILDYMVLIH